MRLRTVLLTAALVACASSAARAQEGGEGRVSVAELKGLAARNAVVILDVRNGEIDRKIKGAAHVPYNDLEGRAAKLPRDREIVTYCA